MSRQEMVEMIRKMRRFEVKMRREGVEQGGVDAANIFVHAGDAVFAMRQMIKIMDNAGR